MTEGIFKPLTDYVITASGTELIIDSSTIVVDESTGVSGTFIPMQVLVHRRDLYNDEQNPLYKDAFTPILGTNGSINLLSNDISTINTALSPLGWYTQYIKNWTYPSPQDLLIYYGWLSSFNYPTNGWNNEKIAQDLAKYNYLVLGDGVASPSHGDYSNTQNIVPRVQGLNQHVQIFGYVTMAQPLVDFKAKVDDWEVLGVAGIFLDETGYDYGKNREEFNECVDYVHSQINANICFINAWNLDHVLGTENDINYPNSIYNPTTITSNLTSIDWCLLESFSINSTAFSANDGYESKTEWQQRGLDAINKRFEYGINLAGIGIINNDNALGQELFNFGFVSAMMWNLDVFGTSDTSYGSGSSLVTHWKRPKTEGLGREWAISPAVQNDYNDMDVYHRFLDYGKLSLDFSASAQKADIERFSASNSFVLRFNAGELTEGQTHNPNKTTASGNPITGLGYDAELEESMYDVFQIPRDWKHGSDAVIHVHFFNDYSQEDSKVCRWALDYQIYSDLETISSKTTTILYTNKVLPTDVAADTFMRAKLIMQADDTNNPIRRNDTAAFRIYRDCTNISDTMENDAVLILLTFEFETEVI